MPTKETGKPHLVWISVTTTDFFLFGIFGFGKEKGREEKNLVWSITE